MIGETSLIVAPPPNFLEPALNQTLIEMRDLALSEAALIGKVETAAENAAATRARINLVSYNKIVEKERVRLNEPALEYSRSLMRLKEKSTLETSKEDGRLKVLQDDFQLKERRRVAEEQQKQQQALDKIEQDKQAALVKAKTPEEKSAIEEKAAEASYIESRPVASTRASGQRVAEDWDIVVTNPVEFARCNPDCVNWEKLPVIMAQIKIHLNSGRMLKGITATKKLSSGVRAMSRKVVEV